MKCENIFLKFSSRQRFRGAINLHHRNPAKYNLKERIEINEQMM